MSEADQCSICLKKLDVEFPEHTSIISRCKHHYCTFCILPWLSGNNTCSLCKKDVFKIKTVYKENSVDKVGLDITTV